MRRPHTIGFALALTAGIGACSPAGLPQLSSAAPAPAATGQVETAAVPRPSSAPIETATIATGTPTEIYSRVAHGALRCWFGADGPLKSTHIFNAEAVPPSQGGAAEIVLHERDDSLGDRRGARAFRVAFVSEGGGVRVAITTIKVEAALAELMVKDVTTWAHGGAGCRVRVLSPPAQAAAPAAKRGKTKVLLNN